VVCVSSKAEIKDITERIPMILEIATEDTGSTENN
jgi:hypothetical protein